MIESHVSPKVRRAVNNVMADDVDRIKPVTRYDGGMLVLFRFTSHQRRALERQGVSVGSVTAESNNRVRVHVHA